MYTQRLSNPFATCLLKPTLLQCTLGYAVWYCNTVGKLLPTTVACVGVLVPALPVLFPVQLPANTPGTATETRQSAPALPILLGNEDGVPDTGFGVAESRRGQPCGQENQVQRASPVPLFVTLPSKQTNLLLGICKILTRGNSIQWPGFCP